MLSFITRLYKRPAPATIPLESKEEQSIAAKLLQARERYEEGMVKLDKLRSRVLLLKGPRRDWALRRIEQGERIFARAHEKLCHLEAVHADLISFERISSA